MGFLDIMKDDPGAGRALRREWSERLCQRLQDAIIREAPGGVGREPDPWSRVNGQCAVLLDHLAAWERTGDDEHRAAAKAAAAAVLSAWREAVREWQRRSGVT